MSPKIKSFIEVEPRVYAYITPEIEKHHGWSKIGYTEKQTPEDRVRQQTHTVDIDYVIEWHERAQYTDGTGELFRDTDFHNYLERHEGVDRIPGTEWFHIVAPESHDTFLTFAARGIEAIEDGSNYVLRDEQLDAVEKTRAYFEAGGTEFLWNAKPRFGKTLTAYDLVRTMGMRNVLVLTNRPAIAHSWLDDFVKFIGWQDGGRYAFVTDNNVLKGQNGVTSRSVYAHRTSAERPDSPTAHRMIAFESLQGLKGSVYFGGDYDKLKWLTQVKFDLLVLDESHEGVDTELTELALRQIKRTHTLFLSGTPFKALADARFDEDQIFNWTYLDEQQAKLDHERDEVNPYEDMPSMEMYTYQMSAMIEGELSKRADLSEGRSADIAFDLNEFFAVQETGAFRHKESVERFLESLTTQEKYPFSTPELRAELSHTLWILDRVDSVRALAKMLAAHPAFKDYKVVVAAGDGKLDEETENRTAYERVKRAIAENDKTITLSVGQLTVGVTIPEWSGVLMLCNMRSAQSYVQAAFRAQNPCLFEKNGKFYRKERAYVFDFDPARTLIVYEQYANSLTPGTAGGAGTAEDHRQNVKRLLNFFPVIAEDDAGKMVPLDASKVLSMPRKIKCEEVVRRGFMSNYLFQNISNLFSSPALYKVIMESLQPYKEPRPKHTVIESIEDIVVDAHGDVVTSPETVRRKAKDLFSEKQYESVEKVVSIPIRLASSEHDLDEVKAKIERHADDVAQALSDTFVNTALEASDLKPRAEARLRRKLEDAVTKSYGSVVQDYEREVRIAATEFESSKKAADTELELQEARKAFEAATQEADRNLAAALEEVSQTILEEQPLAIVETIEREETLTKKQNVENAIRDHLRGFSRTIPSFIMAYGDRNLTLANFDDYTEDDVFREVTGITEDEFRLLRDGGDYRDPETGEVSHTEGHFFDATVFDDSIQQFLDKRDELQNYFDETLVEDIFDYIPPQKTNQIFTPKWVVREMVDLLEQENPGCFDDPNATFADLYMKSGLFITEIATRMYNSEALMDAIPDDGERIRHILLEQLYGMAPTKIIYLIAMNFIFGFNDELRQQAAEGKLKHYALADAAQAAKQGTLQRLVNGKFGR